jgi:hypothetical protein
MSRDGRLHVDADGTPSVLNSMAYKLCYHRYGEAKPLPTKPAGYDVARRVTIGHTGFNLTYVEEAYSTHHWLVRIYRVRDAAEVEGRLLQRQRRGAPMSYQPVPYWTTDGYRTAGGKTEDARAAESAALLRRLGVRFVGCYKTEAAFAGDRVYSRGLAGAQIVAARAHASKWRTRGGNMYAQVGAAFYF